MKIPALLFGVLFAGAVHAVQPSEMLHDPALEARARDVSQVLRCVVCQNETIDESNADIARDMRLLVRARILAGDTNEDVIAFLVSRYGDYVLLKPRFTARTYLLWFGPLVVLVLGAFIVYRRLRMSAGAGPAPLSPEEEAALAKLSPPERAP